MTESIKDPEVEGLTNPTTQVETTPRVTTPWTTNFLTHYFSSDNNNQSNQSLEVLAKHLTLDVKANPRCRRILHYYHDLIQLTVQHLWTLDQQVQVLHLAQELLELMLRPELTPLKEAYDQLRAKVVDPAFESIFSIADIETLVKYFTSTYFSHFRAYQMMFHESPAIRHETKWLVIERPLVSVPLSHGTKC